MQRWIKLPNGSWIDAARICFVSKVETYLKIDDEGNSSGNEYALTIATDFGRDHQMVISGTADDIKAVLKSLLSG